MAAKSGTLAAIGTKMIATRVNYEDVFRTIMGANNADNRVKLDQLW